MNLITNTFFMGISGVLVRVFSLGLIIVMSRIFGPSGLGVYYFAFSFLGMMLQFSDFGLSQFFVREISADKKKSLEHLRTLLTFKFILALLFLLVAFLSITFFIDALEIRITVYLLAGGCFIQLIFGAFGSFMQAYERMEYVSFMMVAERLLTVVLTLIFITSIPSTISIGVAFLLSQLLIALIWLFIIRKKMSISWAMLNFQFGRIKTIIPTLRHSIPFWLSGVFTTISTRSDMIFLQKIRGSAQAGIFGPGRTMIDTFYFILNSVSVSAYPVFSRMHNSNRDEAKKIYNSLVKYLLLIVVFIALGVMTLSEQVVQWFLGPAFSQTAIILKIMIWAEVFIFVGEFSGVLLNAIHRQSSYAVAEMSGTVTNLILISFMIPLFGILGAAYAAVITEFVVLFVALLAIFRNGYSFNFANPAKIGIIALISSIPLFLFPPLVAIFLIAFLYIALAFMTKCINIGELRYLMSIRAQSLKSLTSGTQTDAK
ncbi:MAG: flippase [bacterium]